MDHKQRLNWWGSREGRSQTRAMSLVCEDDLQEKFRGQGAVLLILNGAGGLQLDYEYKYSYIVLCAVAPIRSSGTFPMSLAGRDGTP